MSYALQAIIILCVALGVFFIAAIGLGAHNPEPQTSDYPGVVQVGRREV